MNELIKLHDLAPAPGAKKKKTRVGHGEASKGETVGRGAKGTETHRQVSAAFEGGQMPLHMCLPKLRGFKSPAKVILQVVNVSSLERLFPNGGSITIAGLITKGTVRANQPAKVFDDDGINVFVSVAATKLSGFAKSRIEAAGGSATEA